MDEQPAGTAVSITAEDYDLCYSHSGELFDTYEAFCTPTPIEGRYLIIQILGHESLTLCEVEVFGTYKAILFRIVFKFINSFLMYITEV